MKTFLLLLIGAHASAIAGYFLNYNLFDVELDYVKAGWTKAKVFFFGIISFIKQISGKGGLR